MNCCSDNKITEAVGCYVDLVFILAPKVSLEVYIRSYLEESDKGYYRVLCIPDQRFGTSKKNGWWNFSEPVSRDKMLFILSLASECQRE
jgi:hypothetical protein